MEVARSGLFPKGWGEGRGGFKQGVLSGQVKMVSRKVSLRMDP